MSMHDRPRLSERLRGKEGNDLLNEMKKEFEDNRNAWFSEKPFSRFRREGFPFENDSVFGAKSDAGIKSHLEDLAKKHPEFAHDLKCPPWGGSIDKTWEKAYTVPVSFEKAASSSHEQEANQNLENQNIFKNETLVPNESLKNNLRNTIDIAEQIQKANKEELDIPQRSSSAPPDTATLEKQTSMNKQEPKRFTSKIEITPINPFENTPDSQLGNMGANASNESNISGDDRSRGINIPVDVQKSNVSTSGGSRVNDANASIKNVNVNTGSPQMGRHRTSSNAREIPIITERTQTRSPYDSPNSGRKQPQVRHIPIFVEGRNDPVVPKNEEPVERKHQQEQTPLKRKLDSSGKISTEQSSNGQLHQKQSSPQEKEVPVETSPVPPSKPPPPSKPKDPKERILEVKFEVENFAAQVDQFRGKSRKDKEYLYLDEMLTRNLIKLDTIEVEGNDELRTFRKEVIKQIQAAIAKLESKVPNSEEISREEKSVEENSHEEACNNCMEVDNSQIKGSDSKLNG